MYLYRAFGLTIASQVELPELQETHGTVEISIVRDRVQPPAGGTEVFGHVASPEAVLLRFEDVGSFLLEGGSRVVAEPDHDLDARILRLFLLGPVLGVCLHQRGGLPLHASCVVIGGSGVAFLGDSEWGKSTSAASCYRAGHEVVADDVSWVASPSTPHVEPAFPQLKLWPESARALGWDPELLPRVHPETDKLSIRVEDRFATARAPLRAIYVLEPGGESAIAPIDGQTAVVELVRHSFAADLLEATGTQAAHLAMCAELAERVPMRRLQIGDSPGSIVSLPRRVEDDLSALGVTSAP